MVKLVFQVIDALVVECRDREGGDGCEVLVGEGCGSFLWLGGKKVAFV